MDVYQRVAPLESPREKNGIWSIRLDSVYASGSDGVDCLIESCKPGSAVHNDY